MKTPLPADPSEEPTEELPTGGGRRRFPRLSGEPIRNYRLSVLKDGWELHRELVDITLNGLALVAEPGDAFRVGQRLSLRIRHDGTASQVTLVVRNTRFQDGRRIIGGEFED